jgi:predicted Zn-ribbon and HTH transcriptional regulator
MAEIGKVSPTGTIKEVYWAVHPETEDEKNRGVFVCSYPEKGRGCSRLFVQDKESRNRLCPKCKE